MSKSDPLERVESAHRQRYEAAIHAARREGSASFQSWFNESDGAATSAVRGHWDFAMHLLVPAVCQHLRQPEEKIALEIGYGGGRLLNAACSFFQFAYGVDLHGESDSVSEFLHQQGHSNFGLLSTSGSDIPLPDGSVDFVYSFIVLQHLPTFESFRRYLREAFRCLRPGGVAQLYYGRYGLLPLNVQISSWAAGYRELPEAAVNHTSLVIRRRRVARTARAIGFRIVGAGTSYKRVPDGFPAERGGQRYVTLLKGSPAS